MKGLSVLSVGFCCSSACQMGESSAVILDQMAQLVFVPLGLFFDSYIE